MKKNCFAVMIALIVIAVVLFFLSDTITNDLAQLKKLNNSAGTHSQTILQVNTEQSVSQTSASALHISQQLSSKNDANLDEPVCKDLIDSFKEEKNSSQLKDKINSAYEEGLLTLEALLKQAQQSSQLHHRASALLIEGQLQAQKIRKSTELNVECKASEICLANAEKLALNAAFPNTNEVAKLAMYSNDAQLYGMAFQSCDRVEWRNQGYCLQISADQWAKREPKNGMTWLYVLTQAGQTKKENLNTELDAAVFRLSESTHFKNGYLPLNQFIHSESMQSDNAFIWPELNLLAWQLSSHINMPSYRYLIDYCQTNNLTDNNRRQVCQKNTYLLLDDERSLLHFSLGKNLAEKLSWEKEKLLELKEERDAISGLVMVNAQKKSRAGDDVSNGSSVSCLWNKREILEMEEMMQKGDLAYFRLQMARQKLSQSQLAEIYRQNHSPLRK